MSNELSLVTELAIILIAAGVFTIISKALKQPLILGYIVAGFIVGPNLGLFPQLSADSVKEWSNLGIIFLLFGLGLEFSFKKLIKIGASALTMAGVKCTGMFAVGNLMGHALGWTSMESVFLGGMIGMSSTTIIIKAYTDMGLKNKSYSPLIFGSLVFEDLIAVLMLVLLSTLAVTGKFEGKEMVGGVLKLVFFVILWFVVGIYLIPLILKWSKKYLDDEILLLVGIGLCFGMVVVAESVGFSSALGAFVMGSILAETMEGEKIEKVTHNIKDLFGAIFFVSVGMMVDPAIIAQHWATILTIVVIAMCSILIFSTTGVILAGKGLDTAIHSSFTLAQIGEFSFIIAGLGCSLGVLRDFIYPVIITVSVVTTFTTPYMIKAGDPVSRWLYRVLPDKLITRLSPAEEKKNVSRAESSTWKQLLRAYALRVSLLTIVLTAIVATGSYLLPDLLEGMLPSLGKTAHNWLYVVAMLAIMSPLLVSLANNGSNMTKYSSELIAKNSAYRWPLLALICLRSALAAMFIIDVIGSRFELSWWALITLSVLAILLFLAMAYASTNKIDRLTDTFLQNLNEREIAQRRKTPIRTAVQETLASYNISIETIQISPEFTYIGKHLREMPFREGSGVNIINIRRGKKSLVVPSGEEVIYPGDVIAAVGTPDQLSKFKEFVKDNTIVPDTVGSSDPNSLSGDDFIIVTEEITKESRLCGHTLSGIGMKASGCLVISILHKGTLIANPPADYLIEENDILWIAGERSSIEWYGNMI